MNPFQIFRLAARALRRNLMRSFLTALGIIIGVAAVIAMVSIGEGARSRVEASFASMGTNLLIVMPGSSTSGGARGGFGSQPTLTRDDLAALQNELPLVDAAAADLRTNAQLASGEAGARSDVAVGVDESWLQPLDGELRGASRRFASGRRHRHHAVAGLR